tara:strand:+ start:168 stop:566 length:399 start_codon:yes stop_codon:yes gene_type:complete
VYSNRFERRDVDIERTEEEFERGSDICRVHGILCAFDYVFWGGCADARFGREFSEHIETFGVDVYDTNSDHFGVSVTGAFVSGERAQKAIDVCVSRYDRGSADIWSFVSLCQRERVVVEFILCVRVFFLRHV